MNLLRNNVASGDIHHAYLITGPQGVGRRTLALRLAQAVNCPQPVAPGEPCLTCRTCLQIERMQYPDLAVIQSEQRGAQLKVDQIRELQGSLALAPYEARFRVALLLHFEEANPYASNALLKTLEEPNPRVLLILTAESAELLLPTIVSRCAVLRLRPLPLEQVRLGLQARWGVPEDQARLLASISNGRPGYAVYLHQHPEQQEQRARWLAEHHRLVQSGRVERFKFAESISKNKEALRGLLFVWLYLWRDVMLMAANVNTPSANPDQWNEINALAGRFGWQRASQVVVALENTIRLIDQNVNARLAFEVLLLEIPGL